MGCSQISPAWPGCARAPEDRWILNTCDECRLLRISGKFFMGYFSLGKLQSL